MSSATQQLLKDTLRGLTAAPVPACSCAKGLAVGLKLGWSGLHEAYTTTFTSAAQPSTIVSSAAITASQHSSLQTAVGTGKQISHSSRSAQAGPAEMPEESGIIAAQHSVYMRNMLLRMS